MGKRSGEKSMNRFLKTLIPTFLLVIIVSGCGNGAQSETDYFDPMDAYIAEIGETNFSPAQVSLASLDTSNHLSILKGLNTLTPPRLYANTHQTLIDQIANWTSNSSQASAILKVTEPEIKNLAMDFNLTLNGEINCETVSNLNSFSTAQQSSDLSNFINSSPGADIVLFCDNLYAAEHQIQVAFDRYNELKADRKAVVDDLLSTQ